MSFAEVDRIVEEAISTGIAPGACYAIGQRGQVEIKAFGRLTAAPEGTEARPDTIWDLASLTKVIATTTATMLLYEDGLVDLDQPVRDVLPGFGKQSVAIRNLLLHDSGLPASLVRPYELEGPDDVFERINALDLSYETGADMIYSDVGFIVLGRAIEAITEKPLDQFLFERVWSRLGLEDTMFRVPDRLRGRCAPTERVEPWRQTLRLHRSIPPSEWIVGEVHDPTAMVLGGVAGHAGLFSTASDLAQFMTSLMTGNLVRSSTVEFFTRRASDRSSRALGWDTPSPGSSAGTKLGPRAFGHTGFTGTSIWADPDLDLFAILLTNRVHPTAANQAIRELRIDFIEAIVEAIS